MARNTSSISLSLQGLRLTTSTQPAKYEVHRALLTGLLSSIAHKNEEYLATRNQKAKIFPASALYKKGASMVNGGRNCRNQPSLFTQCLKIEPEWIEQEAKHLLKKSCL